VPCQLDRAFTLAALSKWAIESPLRDIACRPMGQRETLLHGVIAVTNEKNWQSKAPSANELRRIEGEKPSLLLTTLRSVVT
jgi:hypothetical protein